MTIEMVGIGKRVMMMNRIDNNRCVIEDDCVEVFWWCCCVYAWCVSRAPRGKLKGEVELELEFELFE